MVKLAGKQKMRMYKLLSVILISCFMLISFFRAGAQPLDVMTFNIRLNLESDKENAWPNRKELLASQVHFHETDILGVQEALPDQMKDLEKLLPDYRFIGVARDTGKWGEASAIFYNPKVVKVVRSNTFWLSENPSEKYSKGWDAALPRIVTWGEFKHIKSGKTFFVFNTHFDHKGEIARQNSARLILRAVDSLAAKHPVIIMGDFNAGPQSKPYQIVTDKSNPQHLINSIEVSETPHYGPTGTFNNFESKEVNDEPIDYIFIKNGVRVLKHATLSQSWRGRFSSDHFPVFARVSLP